MSRWSHGHSLGAGVLGGLLLERHTLLFMCVAFAAGLAFDRSVKSVRGLVRRLKSRGTVAP